MRTFWPLLLLACDSAVPLADGHADHDAMPTDAAAECPCGSEALQWVVIDDLDMGEFFDFDTSWGTEICWIEAVCDGVPHLGVEAVLVPGDSGRPLEGDPRKDPTLALTRDGVQACFPGVAALLLPRLTARSGWAMPTAPFDLEV